MVRHRISHLCLFFLAFACTLLLVSAAPAPVPAPLDSSTETLYRRQENGNELTQTVVTQTVQTINTFVFLFFSLMGSPLCVLIRGLVSL